MSTSTTQRRRRPNTRVQQARSPAAPGFGAALRARRERAGIGIRELARQIEVSPAYLSKLEGGDIQSPDPEKIIRLAGVLGDPPDQLLLLAGYLPPRLLELVRQHPAQMTALLERLAERASAYGGDLPNDLALEGRSANEPVSRSTKKPVGKLRPERKKR